MWTWKKVPQTIRAIVHTIPALMGNARMHVAHTTFQKGASLRTVRSLYFLFSPSTAQNAFFFLRTTKESFLPDISQKCENQKKEYSFS